jgi:hypothetical protein
MTPYLEYLYHFNCDHCSNWWSIGDWVPAVSIICPHCGKKNLMEVADEVEYEDGMPITNTLQ